MNSWISSFSLKYTEKKIELVNNEIINTYVLNENQKKLMLLCNNANS